MLRSRAAFLPVAFLVALVVMIPFADPSMTAPGEAAEGMVDSWLNSVLQSMQIKIKPLKVLPVVDANLQSTFSGSLFYGIYFATWPVAPRLPKELSYETVVRIQPGGGSVEPIRGIEELKNFLAQNLSNTQDENTARSVALASLRLAEALAKAGSSSFEQPNVSVVRQGNNIIATARAAVQEPNRGEVTIRVEFSGDGKISPGAIKIEDGTRRGPP
jgi:hypothetical protein